MKLPFDLGVKLFFRLVLPGFFVTFGAWPLVFNTLDAFGWPAGREAALVAITMIAGWLLVLLDMPIYMLYEGRRWWPARLRKVFIGHEQRRCTRLQEQVRNKKDRRKSARRSVSDAARQSHHSIRDLSGYPLRNGCSLLLAAPLDRTEQRNA